MPADAAAPISSRRSDQAIDNGNHLLLSANHAALDFLRRIGADGRAHRAGSDASFDFADLADGSRWRICDQ